MTLAFQKASDKEMSPGQEKALPKGSALRRSSVLNSGLGRDDTGDLGGSLRPGVLEIVNLVDRTPFRVELELELAQRGSFVGLGRQKAIVVLLSVNALWSDTEIIRSGVPRRFWLVLGHFLFILFSSAVAPLTTRSASPTPEATAIPHYFLVRSLRNLVVNFTLEGHLSLEESSHNNHTCIPSGYRVDSAGLDQLSNFYFN